MKPFRNSTSGSRGWKLFGSLGWVLVAVLGWWAAPRIYHRLMFQFPASQRQYLEQAMAAKKQELALPWQDPRPLVVLAGDSQIEFGNWYDLFSGAWAVRNGGLARAKIADVTELVSAMGDRQVRAVVLMCGINNNLGNEQNHQACLQDYTRLLATVRAQLSPDAVLVLSVMPVRATPVDQASARLNESVRKFNGQLQALCQQAQADYLDVGPAVADANGNLADALTMDGLHLNPEGYRRLAAVVALRLSQTLTPP